jgi:GTP pyrophosphokinase
MVTTIHTVTRTSDGKIDREAWLNLVSFRYPKEKLKGLSAALQQTDEMSLEIATILLELHADPLAIQAALYLHRLYKNTRDELKKINVSGELLNILMNLYELIRVTQKLDVSKERTLEAMRRMLLAMIKDVRVALIQLAIVTFIARTYKTQTEVERQKMAEAIQAIYAPLANRLGVGQLKWELEDRAFAILQTASYKEISQALQERRAAREIFMQTWMEQSESLLEQLGFTVEVSGRIKHIYSIWRKMQQKNLKFAELYDIRAIRILVPDIPACYQVMAFLHERWTPLVSEYTDYIVQPKKNGYRSLHTVLKGEDGAPIEVQIRTFAMHEEAEKGIAAHWRYKEGGRHDLNFAERLNWLRMLLDWQQEWQGKEQALNDKTIYVFTKDGDVVDLPKNATPIDFAFAVHTDLGLRCKGAYVNGRIVPLNYALVMTDQVEIITHKEPHPSRDWLNSEEGFVKSRKARNRIRTWFHTQEQMVAPLTKIVVPTRTHRETFIKNLAKFDEQAKVILAGMKGLPYQFAKCCMPCKPQAIIGYLTTQRGVIIHQLSCYHIQSLPKERQARLLAAEWHLH